MKVGNEAEGAKANDRAGSWKKGLENMGFPKVGFGTLARLWWGKIRRAALGRVFTGYTRRRHALREGQCKRCGTCCQLGWVCSSLEYDGAGVASCVRYDQHRDPTCQLFPTTESDLKDVQRVRAGAVCGYRFAKKGPGQG